MKNSSIEEAYLSRSDDLTKTTTVFLDTLCALKRRGQRDVETIWNSAFHVNIIDHDISVLQYFYTVTNDVWASRTALRMLVLVIYEAMNDLPKLYGKSFIEACKTADIYDSIAREHKIMKKCLDQFKKENQFYFKDIRVKTAAHKEDEAFQFIQSYLNIKEIYILELAGKFREILNDFGAFSQNVIEQVNQKYKQSGVIY